MSALSTLPDSDPGQFLKTAAQGAALASHFGLGELAQAVATLKRMDAHG